MAEIRGADFVTLLNALLGTTAVLSLIRPLPVLQGPLALSPDHLFLALVTAALIGDGLDGLVARRFGMSSAGRMLDSLSDAITFGLAPAAFAVHVVGPIVVPAVLLFLVCAMWRLAIFTTLTEEKTVFHGLPSPVAGIVLLGVTLLLGEPGFPPATVPMVVFGLAVGLGGLMVSGVRYPKIRGRLMPLLVVFAAAAGVHLVVYFAVPAARLVVVASGLVISLGVVVAAPFFAADDRPRGAPEEV